MSEEQPLRAGPEAGDAQADEPDARNADANPSQAEPRDSSEGETPQPGGASPAGEAAPDPDASGVQAPPAEEPQDRPKRRPMVVVRYGRMGQIGGFRCGGGKLPPVRADVVVRTERGVELGKVIARVCDETGPFSIGHDQLDEFVKACGSDYPFRRNGKLLRPANQQDLIDHRHLNSSAGEEASYCRQQIEELKLDMKLVAVEHLLGGERIVFYFSAENRVDFRELVRRLANQYHTRIEMRQVGARDEARLNADYERCGRQCCCQAYLKDLRPVSMRMAKTQKATLDPNKISGRCGRLMCCLRYEDDGYKELRARLPRRNTWVRAGEYVGRVVDAQILTQLVKLARPDGTYVVVACEEITERDLPAPRKPAEGAGERSRGGRGGTRMSAAAQARQKAATEKSRREERPKPEPAPQEATPSEGGDKPEEGKPRKKRRGGRRGRGKSKSGSGGKSHKTHSKGGQGGSGQSGGTSKKKKRRRRRRKKKPSGGSESS